jgi:starch phosphorylase
LFKHLLPRLLDIIYEINARFMRAVANKWPGDTERLGRMSIIEEGPHPHVRMAHLAIVGSFSVNGVAALHSDLLKGGLFRDFADLWPELFNNKTNGVTQRRWLALCNPRLSDLITRTIGGNWVVDLSELQKLKPHADNPAFRSEWRQIKQDNKRELAAVVKKECGVDFPLDAMFDVQVKRIHEYKRQLLNALHVVHLYDRIKRGDGKGLTKRAVLFGGKAAPGYAMAKTIIRFINAIAEVVNNDPDVGDLLRVAYIPDYRVSLMEKICPAADLSEQISTAGTEASGTGNMKMSMNGALTIGTWDGANVEICEEVGEENMFLFGLTAQDVARRRIDGYDPGPAIAGNDELRKALELIGGGYFSPDQPDRFRPVVELLTSGDHYLLTADYPLYMAAQERVDQLYRNPDEWTRKAILNVARMGKFSSDRTVAEYAREIWNVQTSD